MRSVIERIEIIIKETPSDSNLPEIIDIYDEVIGGEESKNYEECKCPGAVRTMWGDIMSWYIKSKMKYEKTGAK